MEKTHVISLRLPESLIKDIGAFCLSMTYWKRNSILVCLLTNLLANADINDLQKIVRWHKWKGTKLRIIIEEKEIS